MEINSIIFGALLAFAIAGVVLHKMTSNNHSHDSTELGPPEEEEEERDPETTIQVWYEADFAKTYTGVTNWETNDNALIIDCDTDDSEVRHVIYTTNPKFLRFIVVTE